MSELRKDPVLERWVIIAPERSKRPRDFRRPAHAPEGGTCPFCPGNEGMTPSEIIATRPGHDARRDGPGWKVRVVPNKFPALRVETPLSREGEGPFDRISGLGAHEVIIETPAHDKGFGDLSPGELEQVLWTWSERMRDLARDERLRAVMVFKNHGDEAGATLEHPHSQLVALPIVPRDVVEEMEGALAHYRTKERCIWCDVVRHERRERSRLVVDGEKCVALAPWAPRVPFETWVLPTRHAAHFEDEPRETVAAVADTLREVVRRLDVALEKPAYNVLLKSAPLRERGLPHFHWHLEVLPALGRVAGFEWGSGFFVNPVPPEEAAEFLRGVSG